MEKRKVLQQTLAFFRSKTLQGEPAKNYVSVSVDVKTRIPIATISRLILSDEKFHGDQPDELLKEFKGKYLYRLDTSFRMDSHMTVSKILFDMTDTIDEMVDRVKNDFPDTSIV